MDDGSKPTHQQISTQTAGKQPPDLSSVNQETSTFLTDDAASRVCQTFAEGLRSGMNLSHILKMLQEGTLDTTVCERLEEAIFDDGLSLAEAFQRHGLLDPSDRQLIHAAEKQGRIADTFRQLADIYRKRYRRRKNFAFALAEPLLLIGLGVLVLPRIIRDYALDVAADLESAALGPILVEAGIDSGFFWLGSAAVLFLWLNLPVDFGPRHVGRALALRIPIIGRPNRARSLAHFFRYLGQSIASGMTVFDGLKLATDSSRHPKLRRRLSDIRGDIKAGKTLTAALRNSKALSGESLEYLQVGEESGNLDEQLEFLAERFDEKADERTERHLRVLQLLFRFAIIIVVLLSAFATVGSLAGTLADVMP